VEVQLKGTDLDYTKRSLYYTTRLYSDQLKSGHDYHLLERSVSISLLDFILFPEGQELHSTFSLWDRAQDFQLTRDLELHYIELPKFTPDKPRSLQTRFERWLYILKFSDLYHTRELPENLREEEGIQMAIDAMRNAYARDEIRAVIEAQEMAKRDEISRISFAERKGRDEGLEEGLEKGLEKGMEKGREETSLEVARRMLARGADRAFILEVTELSEQELATLENEQVTRES